MDELERIYTIPLGKAYAKPRVKRARIAVKILRAFVARHMKVGDESVSMSGVVNSAVWESGIKKPPRRLKIIANRDKEGKVKVTLVGEKEEAAKRAEKEAKKRDAKKKPAEKKAEEKQVEKAVPESEPQAEKKPENGKPPADSKKK